VLLVVFVVEMALGYFFLSVANIAVVGIASFASLVILLLLVILVMLLRDRAGKGDRGANPRSQSQCYQKGNDNDFCT
jgi:hypothetical protein